MKSQSAKLDAAIDRLHALREQPLAVELRQATTAAESMAGYITNRFVKLGAAGANANLSHPDRAEWEALRMLVDEWDGRA